MSFLDAMPELREDFATPALFSGFSGASGSVSIADGRGDWHMLSLGGSRAGLPSHVHGETRRSRGRAAVAGG